VGADSGEEEGVEVMVVAVGAKVMVLAAGVEEVVAAAKPTPHAEAE